MILSAAFRKTRFPIIACVFWALAFVYHVSPALAWNLSCAELCAAPTAIQSYGTGAADLPCLAACHAGEECWNAKGEKLWEVYFKCLDGGQTIEQCWPSYVDAKECAVCDQGQVAPWNPADVVFVNGPGCQANGPQTGTHDQPFCRFNDGLDVAIDRQENARPTKVVVCEGTYREGYDGIDGRPIDPPGLAPVVVEAATRDSAVISGSEDWSGVWLPEAVPITEIIHNELRRTSQLNHGIWLKNLIDVDPVFVPDPPAFAVSGSTTKVFRMAASASANASAFLALQQQIPSLPDKLATFSIYIRPDEASRFRMDFRVLDNGAEKTGAFYAFELPPDPLCNNDLSSGAESYGVEDAGNGWYRVHLTQRVDTPPNQSPSSIERVRFQLLGPLDQSEGAEIFAPQLDHRPLEHFDAAPRTYLATGNNPVHTPFSRIETFYVNDSSQKSWTHDWGLARHSKHWPTLPPLMRRAEMVYIDGQPLRQELSTVDMEPGSFLVEDGVSLGGYNHKNNRRWVSGLCDELAPCPIRILPPPGVNMAQAKVEVAVEPRLLWLNPVWDWEIRGLRFEHSTGAYDIAQQGDCLGDESSADCRFPMLNSAVALINAKDVTLLENRFDWNNAYGLGVAGGFADPGNGLRLLDNTANDNGIAGESLGFARGFFVRGEEFSRNNWRGRRTGVMGNATTGAKYSFLADGSITNIVAEDNHGHGLWFDFGNQATEVTNGFFSGNSASGIYFEGNDKAPELGFDPTLSVTGCHLEGNAIGVRGISSSSVVVAESVLLDNRTAFSLIGIPRVEAGEPTKYLRDWTLAHNKVRAACASDLWMHYGDTEPAWGEWQPFMESMDSNHNEYAHPLGIAAEGFVINHVKATLPLWNGCTLANDPWCFLAQDSSSQVVP